MGTSQSSSKPGANSSLEISLINSLFISNAQEIPVDKALPIICRVLQTTSNTSQKIFSVLGWKVLKKSEFTMFLNRFSPLEQDPSTDPLKYMNSSEPSNFCFYSICELLTSPWFKCLESPKYLSTFPENLKNMLYMLSYKAQMKIVEFKFKDLELLISHYSKHNVASNCPLLSFANNTVSSLPEIEHQSKPTRNVVYSNEIGITLLTSNFNKIYPTTQAPKFQYQVFSSVHILIKAYAKKYDISEGDGDRFFNDLQEEQMKNKHEILKEVEGCCQRIWTSGLKLDNKGFYSILNEFIINDDLECMEHVCLITHGINSLCINRGTVMKNQKKYPKDNTLYRGSSIPDEHKQFFINGKKYRCPSFLATSRSRKISQNNFCLQAENEGKIPILWIIHLDPDLGCAHMNYVDRTNIPGEDEFLFVPYSAFEVKETLWQENSTWDNPHIVHIKAAVDNNREDLSLPLAPWH